MNATIKGDSMLARVTRIDRPRPVQQRGVETRERILSAASAVLVEVGRDRLSTADVAEHAGVSIGSIYRYFPDRAALIEAVLERDPIHVAQLQVCAAAAAVAVLPDDLQHRVALIASVSALVAALRADTGNRASPPCVADVSSRPGRAERP